MKNLFLARNNGGLVDLLVKYNYCSLFEKNENFSKQALQPLIDTFIELTNLPLEERKKWEIDADRNGDPDDGLIERNGGIYDHKFFFHYKSMSRLLRIVSKTDSYQRNSEKWDDFLSGLKIIHQQLTETMYVLVRTFDELFPEYDLLKKVQNHDAESRGILRLLYYKPGHTVVARPHYDQSLFTFHVADSHPGLIVGRENEKTNSVYVPKNDNTILVFPGIKAEIATHGFIPAAYHSAVAGEHSSREGRWSIVFFYHCDVDVSASDLTSMIRQKIISNT